MDPDAYDRLLRSYYRVLGQQPKLWWQEHPGAASEAWARCVRDAIGLMAQRANLPARTLADWLDDHPLPRACAAVLASACEKAV